MKGPSVAAIPPFEPKLKRTVSGAGYDTSGRYLVLAIEREGEIRKVVHVLVKQNTQLWMYESPEGGELRGTGRRIFPRSKEPCAPYDNFRQHLEDNGHEHGRPHVSVMIFQDDVLERGLFAELVGDTRVYLYSRGDPSGHSEDRRIWPRLGGAK